ncbi:MAG: HAMP domain-containing histidine kinase [Bacteroidales bacterium]|nr:HAMP domain-containing histidine kinase [Bacteroidales bacterium]
MEIKSFTEYYNKQIRIAYVILIVLTIVINLLDLNNLDFKSISLLIINTSTITLLIITLIIYFLGKLKLHIAVSLAMYIIVANFFFSYISFFRPKEELLDYLMRETLFLLLMMFFGGLFLHRNHAIAILVFMLFRYISLTIYLKPPFLLENIFTYSLTFIALTSVVYFLSGKLHQSILEIQLKQSEIIRKNEDLSIKNISLQKMNTSKDKFFAIISHDLRNPLNALKGFVDLFTMKGNSLAEEKRESYLSNMRSAIDNINELLSDLLEWSRSQSNQMSFNPSHFRLSDLSDTVCYYLKQVAELKEITLEDLTDRDAEANADFNMMFTVMRNLVSNAIKFSNNGTVVTILSEDLGMEYRMKIIDQGTGIDPENIRKLFQINEAFSTPGTNDEKGTGLGLILCKEFVEKNRGIIGVESEPGKGSSFWFTLPKSQHG